MNKFPKYMLNEKASCGTLHKISYYIMPKTPRRTHFNLHNFSLSKYYNPNAQLTWASRQ